MAAIPTITVTVPELGDVPLSFTSYGDDNAAPILLLHGGGGPATVTGWAEHAATTLNARIIAPIHPGFDYTPRPDTVTTIRDLAAAEAALLTALNLTNVTVVGNSIGGWIAAEIALLHPAEVTRLVLIDSVGITVDGHPIPDFFTMTPQDLAQATFADPATYAIDFTTLPEPVRERMSSNRAPLNLYAGSSMADPTLTGRLPGIDVPTLVLWGEADGIADLDYGRTLASLIPDATFTPIPTAAHLPQIEQPTAVTDAIAAHGIR